MLSVLTVHVVYSRFADEVCVRCRGVGNSCSWGPATNLEDLDNSSCEGSGVSGHDNVTLAGFHIDASKGWLLLLSAHNKARVLGERLLLSAMWALLLGEAMEQTNDPLKLQVT